MDYFYLAICATIYIAMGGVLLIAISMIADVIESMDK